MKGKTIRGARGGLGFLRPVRTIGRQGFGQDLVAVSFNDGWGWRQGGGSSRYRILGLDWLEIVHG